MYVQIRDLPNVLQSALSSVGYARKDIDVEARETESMAAGGSGDGRRAFVLLVDLATGRTEQHMGSWGGPNMFNPHNAVDLDTTPRPLPPGMALIHGSSGYKGCYASISLHPENVQKLLPPPVEVTEREQKLLGVMGYKSGYRKECLARMDATTAEIDALVSRGFLSRNRAGAISLTTDGRNARKGF